MSRTTPKPFQDAAKDSGLLLFGECKRLLDLTPDDEKSRAAAVSQHGMLLLEAPTGAGKTLIAGHIVESFSAQEGVVWFWFAPFKGVTGQTASALRAELPGLRLRELSEDRQAADSRTGDVFVTTWQTVATRVRPLRNCWPVCVKRNSASAWWWTRRTTAFLGRARKRRRCGFSANRCGQNIRFWSRPRRMTRTLSVFRNPWA
jgi:superfamily II DNA or RNA helicase